MEGLQADLAAGEALEQLDGNPVLHAINSRRSSPSELGQYERRIADAHIILARLAGQKLEVHDLLQFQ